MYCSASATLWMKSSWRISVMVVPCSISFYSFEFVPARVGLLELGLHRRERAARGLDPFRALAEMFRRVHRLGDARDLGLEAFDQRRQRVQLALVLEAELALWRRLGRCRRMARRHRWRELARSRHFRRGRS